jgi:hypothetical protein
MPITLNGDTGITTPMYNGSITANAVTPSVNMKNRIINGAMVIDQRNAGASVTPANLDYTLDRWRCGLTQSSKFSVEQTISGTSAPAGFTDYLGVTSLSAYSVTSSDLFRIEQKIEGYNTADLAWGSASAKTITLSFWIRSSLTGSFGGCIRNEDGNRFYPFTYTVSSSNTWEQKSVTIAGDTTGTWATTNGTGVWLVFSLGAGTDYSGTAGAWTGTGTPYAPTGSVSVVGTNGATFYITGVQLEVGSTATSFDYRPYGTELALCQRYYAKMSAGTGAFTYFGFGLAASSTDLRIFFKFPTTMRSSPTTNQSSCQMNDSTTTAAISAVSTGWVGTDTAQQSFTSSSMTTNRATAIAANNSTSAFVDFSAEL